MNKKRILLTVLAMVLVCVLSVAGTLALLAETTTNPVVNTFVASVPDPDDFVDAFAILEYKVDADDAGNYDYVTTGEGENKTKVEVAANTYNVVPGITLPKDAFVKLSRTNETPAYLFIEVDNNLDTSVFTMNVDTTKWTKLETKDGAVTGKNGGDIYVLSEDTTKDDATVLGAVANGTEYHIISGNNVTVKNTNNLNITDTSKTINFYAYICQATVAKTVDGVTTNTSVPAEVFGICFPNS